MLPPLSPNLIPSLSLTGANNPTNSFIVGNSFIPGKVWKDALRKIRKKKYLLKTLHARLDEIMGLPKSEMEMVCILTTKANAQIVIDYFGDVNLVDLFKMHGSRLKEGIIKHFDLDIPCKLRIKQSMANWQREKQKFWRKFLEAEHISQSKEKEGTAASPLGTYIRGRNLEGGEVGDVLSLEELNALLQVDGFKAHLRFEKITSESPKETEVDLPSKSQSDVEVPRREHLNSVELAEMVARQGNEGQSEESEEISPSIEDEKVLGMEKETNDKYTNPFESSPKEEGGANSTNIPTISTDQLEAYEE